MLDFSAGTNGTAMFLKKKNKKEWRRKQWDKEEQKDHRDHRETGRAEAWLAYIPSVYCEDQTDQISLSHQSQRSSSNGFHFLLYGSPRNMM